MDKVVVYWAAPCFTQAERMWNRLCAENLRTKGYDVILPQDEDKNSVLPSGKLDFQALAENCRSQAVGSDLVVAILDGPDPDSGMSMEAGFKIQAGGLVIGVRTDFRRAEDGHLNAMFQLFKAIIYFLSFNESYQELCGKIDEKIQELLP